MLVNIVEGEKTRGPYSYNRLERTHYGTHYRVEIVYQDGSSEVVEIPGTADRVYLMNEAGATVDSIPPKDWTPTKEKKR